MRPSLLVEHAGITLLFDASPDIRQQLLHTKTSNLNAVFITHFHFDHFWGLGDLAQLTWTNKNKFPVYVNEQTKTIIDTNYSWMDLDFKIINSSINVGDFKVTPFLIKHSVELFGFIIEILGKKIIYAPDLNDLDNPSQNADLLIADGMYILGKYIDDDDHAGGDELKKIIDSFNAKKVLLLGHSNFWAKKSAKDVEDKFDDKYSIPDDFDIIEL